jgi:chaperone modulatory protein CbpM
MIPVQEFCVRARLEYQVVDGWIAAGWLIPCREPDLGFNEVDLARAALIRELKEDLGINDEGISVVLHLLDQLHGLRRSMADLLDEVRRSRPL